MTTSNDERYECAILTPDGPIFDPELVPDHDPPLMGFRSRRLMRDIGYTKEQIFLCHPPIPGDPDYDEFESLRQQQQKR